jgi:CysZ protein
MLSAAAERVAAGNYRPDAPMTLRRFFFDLWEGVKIALFGLIVTGLALVINFIPGIGQLAVLFLYTAYATLMFIDFPASRAGWPLRRKLGWLLHHRTPALRLGLLPALVSMVPLVNIFALALLFPLFTIHATLNFAAIEKQGSGEHHAD